MRFLLYLTAFISGFVMMGFEILGVRVLTPFFGSSVYVWGATISVFLAGLSIGYASGGKIADNRADGKILALFNSVPALLIIFFPLYGYAVANLIFALELDSRFGTLLASIILFFVPSIFIGMILPVITEMLAEEIRKTGSAVGNVYAISTAGSIVGTLFTSFYLISWIGVQMAILINGLLLVLSTIICLIYHYAESRSGIREITE
jgi:predicted membrane-bound spermidine synthase